jgi:DNA anti-recombination protein RmuC
MDWKTIGNYVLLLGLFAAMVTMFNQVNGRLDTLQAETNRRFDEMNRRFDAMQMEMNRRFEAMQTEMNRRFDAFQTENQRQHDTMQEVLRVFEGRVTRLEEKAGVSPENAE